MKHKIICGDALENTKPIKDKSMDGIFTDPPYGIGFLGSNWDKTIPSKAVWQECLRVLKPGAFMFCMSLPRQDVLSRMIVNIEDAGFNVAFPSIYHTFSSGFPKASNISKAVDKQNGRTQTQYKALGVYLRKHRGDMPQSGIAKRFPSKTGGLTGCVSNWELGYNVPTCEQWEVLKNVLHLDNRFDELIEREEAEREVIGKDKRTYNYASFDFGREWDITKPATPQAKALEGFYAGYAPKPCVEVVIVAMKPIEHATYTAQALDNGHGCTNLDAGRIPYESEGSIASNPLLRKTSGAKIMCGGDKNPTSFKVRDEAQEMNINSKGRFAPHLLVEDDVLNDGTIRKSTGGMGEATQKRSEKFGMVHRAFQSGIRDGMGGYGDSGSFSRYFSLDTWWNARIAELPKEVQKTFPFLIVPKENKANKNKGLECKQTNAHPTVKSLKLISYLITIASREGDTILDPYVGSGTTLVAAEMLNRNAIGIERNKEYCNIAYARLLSDVRQLKIDRDSSIEKIGF